MKIVEQSLKNFLQQFRLIGKELFVQIGDQSEIGHKCAATWNITAKLQWKHKDASKCQPDQEAF